MDTPFESQLIHATSSKDVFYIEYSEKIENGENLYSLHFSFHNSKDAQMYLEKVKKWGLPHEIYGNRVTLLPSITLDTSQSIGISGYRVKHAYSSDFEDIIYIVFSCDEHAFEFYQAQSYNFDMGVENQKPKAALNDDTYGPKPFSYFVSFKKIDLIPFSIDKRAAKTFEMVRPIVWRLFLFKEITETAQFPFDIFKYIMEQTWELMGLVIEPFIKEFALLTQYKICPVPKTECYLEYLPVLNDIGTKTPILYLRVEDASIFQKVDKNTRLPLLLKDSGKTIEIGPLLQNLNRYGSFYFCLNDEINIQFKSEYELMEFLKYVTLLTVSRDNQKVELKYTAYKNVLHFQEKDLNLHEYENKIRAIFKDIDLILNTTLVPRDNESKREREIRIQQMACFNQLKIAVRQGIYTQKKFGNILFDWLKSSTDLIPRGKTIADIMYLTRDGTYSHQAETYLKIRKLEETHKSPNDVSFRTLLSQMRFG